MGSFLGTPLRIAISFALSCFSVCLVARNLGMFPDPRPAVLAERRALCEAVAASCSIFASRQQNAAIEATLEFVLERNPAVISAALRRSDGRIVVEAGPHQLHWHQERRSDGDSCLSVPILAHGRPWGQLEMRFHTLYPGAWDRVFEPGFLNFVGFVTPATALVFLLSLRGLLRVMDPSRAVPERVRSALDTLAEGVLLLDDSKRIVMANRAFADRAGAPPEDLIGHEVSELPWSPPDGPSDEPFWYEGLGRQRPQSGAEAVLGADPDSRRVFQVSSTPILDDKGQFRGSLATFDDVTPLKEKQQELVSLLNALHRSQDEIREQNAELRVLATRDPLTGCLNRRTFFEQFSALWADRGVTGQALSCVMVDVDHFKTINDTYGHSMGDEVLRRVSATLRERARAEDLVCRYGGEEFAIVFPGLELDEGVEMAETFRRALSELAFPGFQITASFGASSRTLASEGMQTLLDQADKSLYYSKRNGRNQVSRWDLVEGREELSLAPTPSPTTRQSDPGAESIPFEAVTALMSALAYRDAETAAHSARVADYAVRLGKRHLPPSSLYVLEMAALLHDIGKIGVPDSILLKPGPLTTEEWDVMAMHDRFGVEIINTSFRCEPLTEIVRSHHYSFGSQPGGAGACHGQEIPLGARIISIVDAFDAMVSDRVYRPGRSVPAACAELRRCAGQQFDPELVEEFIELVSHDAEPPGRGAGQVSQQIALCIGLQVERLAGALESCDLPSARALLQRLEQTAARYQVPALEERAHHLLVRSEEDAQLDDLLEAAQELVTYCRGLHAEVLSGMKTSAEPVGS